MLPHIGKSAGHAQSAEHYRELAVDTLARSERAGSADARMRYFLLAAYWYERALECEHQPETIADVPTAGRPH